MKGIKLCAVCLAAILLLTACKGSELKAGDYKTSTLSIDKQGRVQSAIVESFDKEYYKADDLKKYLKDVADQFNETAGRGSMKLTSFKVSGGNASAVFSYKSIDDYAAANEVTAACTTLSDAGELLPDQLKSLDGNDVNREEVLADKAADKMKAIVLTEEYDVIIPGTILYYAEGSVISDSSVHTNADVTSVILYK